MIESMKEKHERQMSVGSFLWEEKNGDHLLTYCAQGNVYFFTFYFEIIINLQEV